LHLICPEFDIEFRIETNSTERYIATVLSTKQGSSEITHEWRHAMPWLVALMMLLLGVPVTEPTNVARAWDARTIVWQKVDSDGTKWSVLQGRSDVPGEAFTYAAFVPAGFRDFHSHTSDARVAVVQGVLKVSFGETLDLEHLKSYPVGSFLFVPANVRHTMAADEDTIIIGTAVGPWHTHHPGDQHHH
jgi:quercetin dioxygenase-like cupin family protein